MESAATATAATAVATGAAAGTIADSDGEKEICECVDVVVFGQTSNATPVAVSPGSAWRRRLVAAFGVRMRRVTRAGTAEAMFLGFRVPGATGFLPMGGFLLRITLRSVFT